MVAYTLMSLATFSTATGRCDATSDASASKAKVFDRHLVTIDKVCVQVFSSTQELILVQKVVVWHAELVRKGSGGGRR